MRGGGTPHLIKLLLQNDEYTRHLNFVIRLVAACGTTGSTYSMEVTGTLNTPGERNTVSFFEEDID